MERKKYEELKRRYHELVDIKIKGGLTRGESERIMEKLEMITRILHKYELKNDLEYAIAIRAVEEERRDAERKFWEAKREYKRRVKSMLETTSFSNK